MKEEIANGNEQAIQPGVQGLSCKAGRRMGGGGARNRHGSLIFGETFLRRWMRKLMQEPQQAFPGKGLLKPVKAEIVRLDKEIAKLKLERDILKETAAHFARELM